MKKIIVFGASGDTGKYFVDYLLNTVHTDFEIIASGTKDCRYYEHNNIKYIKVDITQKKDFDKLPKDDVYAVVDLAGFMPARMKGYDPYKYIDVNITGNLNILEFCRKNHVSKILYAQSFGDIKNYAEKDILLKPDMKPDFSYNTDHTIYVMTKNFTVDMIKNYNQMYGISAFIFRLPTIYLYSKTDIYFVDGEERKIGYRLLIDNAIEGKDIEIWGDKTRKKDMVYVKDFCQMMYKALISDRKFGHYNVGTGVGTSLEKQIEGIIDVFSDGVHKSKIIERKDKPNSPQYIMDIQNAKDELGYEPKYNYIEMLKDLKREMNEKRFDC